MIKIRIIRVFLAAIFALAGAACDSAWNNPHQSHLGNKNVAFTSFSEPPKTLDPAKAYSEDEYRFIAQIYEPPFQYQYLHTPITLVPLTAQAMPTITYLDKNHHVVPASGEVAYSVYEITIKPHIYYQAHAGFAKNAKGDYLYHALSEHEIAQKNDLNDFPVTATRELVADDYVYQIKRLADPRLNSPIYGLMSHYIVGMQTFHDTMLANLKRPDQLDLRKLSISGVKALDRYRYQIILNGKYPQFIYWLAMVFFSPVPWEVDQFYQQPGMAENNINFDWEPVGTGPFYLSENNPNQRMVLKRNCFYHDDYFPTASNKPKAKQEGYLINAGKKLPLLDQVVFELEKESIPRWNKFLQGYYDNSGVSSDSFDQAIHIGLAGSPNLTAEMTSLGIHLQTTTSPSIYYMGFNMLDPVVGGNSERARKLRQAISIVMDFREYVAIFNNGRGTVAQGPIPPGIFGFIEGQNPISNQTLSQAKKLLAEAGYPQGRDAKTGQPLELNFDATSSSGPDDKARFDWLRKQFEKLNIQLNVRATEYNRFQDKIRTGVQQIYFFGWNADYPDPENFLFLFYGKNGKVKFGGENASNYQNAEFDALFERMKNMDNTPARLAVIDRMVTILREDAPWVFGFFPSEFVLDHQWVAPMDISAMGENNLKYMQINVAKRQQMIALWNKPHVWPIAALALGFLCLLIPVIMSYRKKERTALKEEA